MKLEHIDTDLALLYMGSRGRDVSLLMPLVRECEERLLKAVDPRYTYRYFSLDKTEDGLTLRNTDLILRGNSIAEHLRGCDACILLCATLSAGADTLIRKLSAEDMASAFVTDCLASAAIEAVCDAAENEIKDKLPGKFFTWRFSPGYGDLPLEIQQKFVAVMNSAKLIGLNVTDSLMLVPTKSVTAVIGVSDTELPRSVRGCGCCNMKDTCRFRKEGYHCGS